MSENKISIGIYAWLVAICCLKLYVSTTLTVFHTDYFINTHLAENFLHGNFKLSMIAQGWSVLFPGILALILKALPAESIGQLIITSNLLGLAFSIGCFVVFYRIMLEISDGNRIYSAIFTLLFVSFPAYFINFSLWDPEILYSLLMLIVIWMVLSRGLSRANPFILLFLLYAVYISRKEGIFFIASFVTAYGFMSIREMRTAKPLIILCSGLLALVTIHLLAMHQIFGVFISREVEQYVLDVANVNAPLRFNDNPLMNSWISTSLLQSHSTAEVKIGSIVQKLSNSFEYFRALYSYVFASKLWIVLVWSLGMIALVQRGNRDNVRHAILINISYLAFFFTIFVTLYNFINMPSVEFDAFAWFVDKPYERYFTSVYVVSFLLSWIGFYHLSKRIWDWILYSLFTLLIITNLHEARSIYKTYATGTYEKIENRDFHTFFGWLDTSIRPYYKVFEFMRISGIRNKNILLMNDKHPSLTQPHNICNLSYYTAGNNVIATFLKGQFIYYADTRKLLDGNYRLFVSWCFNNVEIADSASHPPDYVISDEPLIGIDPIFANQWIYLYGYEVNLETSKRPIQ